MARRCSENRTVTLSWRKKTVYSIVVFAAFFGSLEAALRISLFRFTPPSPSLIVWSPSMDEQMADPRSTFRFHRQCFWEPRPNAGYFDLNVDFGAINSSGFRGPDYPIARSPDSYRIACLGDSSTFGMLVQEPDTYPRQLERRLQDAIGRRVEVINAGVIAYTILQGRARYESRVRPYRPDLLVLAFGAINEAVPASHLPDRDLAQRTQRIWSLEPTCLSFLARLRTFQLALWLSPSRQRAAAARQDTLAKYQLTRIQFERGDPYLPRVAVHEFRDCLEQWITDAIAQGTRVVLVSPPREPTFEQQHPQLMPYTHAIEQVARDRRVPCIDARGHFVANPQALFRDNVHPSASGHQLIADLLTDPVLLELKRSGHDTTTP